MKTSLKLLVILGVCGCSADMPTVAPGDPPPIRPTVLLSISGFVVDDSGLCINGAVVRIIRGQGLDRTATQPGPCGAWDYSGGFTFNDLTPGVELTLRATAPGFVTQEKKVTPEFVMTPVVLWAIRE